MLHLPASVDVVEVGPRDGLQSFSRVLSTDVKYDIIMRLLEAGLRTIEVTGFAHPGKIPQLADAEALCARLPRPDGVRYRGMAPNRRGAERAVACGIDEVVGLLTVSETYLAKNQNMTMERAIAEAIGAFEVASGAGASFVMAIGLAFWCPYEGAIHPDRVIEIVSKLHKAGIRRFYLAATVGLEDPMSVSALFHRLRDRWADIELGFHVHNLAGRASALTLAAVDGGASWVEGAICGIGGGIAMPEMMSAPGNYATEDLVGLMSDSGVATGLNVEEIANASRAIARSLEITPRSYAGNGATRQALSAMVGTSTLP